MKKAAATQRKTKAVKKNKLVGEGSEGKGLTRGGWSEYEQGVRHDANCFSLWWNVSGWRREVGRRRGKRVTYRLAIQSGEWSGVIVKHRNRPTMTTSEISQTSARHTPSCTECRALPCLAEPCRSLPCLTVPCRAGPSRALPCRAVPCRAGPSRAAPCRAVPRRQLGNVSANRRACHIGDSG